MREKLGGMVIPQQFQTGVEQPREKVIQGQNVYCEYCDFLTHSETSHATHLTTKKHKRAKQMWLQSRVQEQAWKEERARREEGHVAHPPASAPPSSSSSPLKKSSDSSRSERVSSPLERGESTGNQVWGDASRGSTASPLLPASASAEEARKSGKSVVVSDSSSSGNTNGGKLMSYKAALQNPSPRASPSSSPVFSSSSSEASSSSSLPPPFSLNSSASTSPSSPPPPSTNLPSSVVASNKKIVQRSNSVNSGAAGAGATGSNIAPPSSTSSKEGSRSSSPSPQPQKQHQQVCAPSMTTTTTTTATTTAAPASSAADNVGKSSKRNSRRKRQSNTNSTNNSKAQPTNPSQQQQLHVQDSVSSSSCGPRSELEWRKEGANNSLAINVTAEEGLAPSSASMHPSQPQQRCTSPSPSSLLNSSSSYAVKRKHVDDDECHVSDAGAGGTPGWIDHNHHQNNNNYHLHPHQPQPQVLRFPPGLFPTTAAIAQQQQVQLHAHSSSPSSSPPSTSPIVPTGHYILVNAATLPSHHPHHHMTIPHSSSPEQSMNPSDHSSDLTTRHLPHYQHPIAQYHHSHQYPQHHHQQTHLPLAPSSHPSADAPSFIPLHPVTTPSSDDANHNSNSNGVLPSTMMPAFHPAAGNPSNKPLILHGPRFRSTPPWLKNFEKPELVSLNEEIRAFCNFISPVVEERRMREDVINRITTVVKSLWSNTEVRVFGSCSTDIYLPTSDIDLCVLGVRSWGRSPLFALSSALRRGGIASQIQCITTARVPIIKMVDYESGCLVDISFNIPNGPANTAIIRRYLEELPEVRPLALLLKYYLKQLGLNEPYTGGIGSYTLLLMIISYLQIHRPEEPKEEHNLGVLLLGFLELYGERFNYHRTGISVRNGGSYFAKSSRGWEDWQQPWLLSVEDPCFPENDVSRSSYAIMEVRDVFANAYRILKRAFERKERRLQQQQSSSNRSSSASPQQQQSSSNRLQENDNDDNNNSSSLMEEELDDELLNAPSLLCTILLRDEHMESHRRFIKNYYREKLKQQQQLKNEEKNNRENSSSSNNSKERNNNYGRNYNNNRRKNNNNNNNNGERRGKRNTNTNNSNNDNSNNEEFRQHNNNNNNNHHDNNTSNNGGDRKRHRPTSSSRVNASGEHSPLSSPSASSSSSSASSTQSNNNRKKSSSSSPSSSSSSHKNTTTPSNNNNEVIVLDD